MDSLTEETWDVLIVGTSLPQALLALSLSRSGLKILHVDHNDFYGGSDAALSLLEVQTWAEKHSAGNGPASNATVITTNKNDQLLPSRAYTISLKPQILYAQSRCLPSLVSSRIHTQLEFHAVGPWWILKEGRLQKIPSNREDVFADNTLSHREKRGLMKFLRFVIEDQSLDTQEIEGNRSLQDVLTNKFSLPMNMQIPILALALTYTTAADTEFQDTLSRVKRHLRSMNYFGPGFAAVTAKYGSNAEVAQVACRSCAVGGGVYLLGYALERVQMADHSSTSLAEAELSGGTQVKARFIVGAVSDLPSALLGKTEVPERSEAVRTAFQTSIISNPLKSLFPAPPEHGSMPASAIVFVDDGTPENPPIYLQVHSEDTGECPSGQCVIYASTRYVNETSQSRLSSATQSVLDAHSESSNSPEVLWTLSYISEGSESSLTPPSSLVTNEHGNVLAFVPSTYDIAFEDNLLDQVKAAWRRIVGEDADDTDFMRFDEGRATEEEDE